MVKDLFLLPAVNNLRVRCFFLFFCGRRWRLIDMHAELVERLRVRINDL